MDVRRVGLCDLVVCVQAKLDRYPETLRVALPRLRGAVPTPVTTPVVVEDVGGDGVVFRNHQSPQPAMMLSPFLIHKRR